MEKASLLWSFWWSRRYGLCWFFKGQFAYIRLEVEKVTFVLFSFPARM